MVHRGLSAIPEKAAVSVGECRSPCLRPASDPVSFEPFPLLEEAATDCPDACTPRSLAEFESEEHFSPWDMVFMVSPPTPIITHAVAPFDLLPFPLLEEAWSEEAELSPRTPPLPPVVSYSPAPLEFEEFPMLEEATDLEGTLYFDQEDSEATWMPLSRAVSLEVGPSPFLLNIVAEMRTAAQPLRPQPKQLRPASAPVDVEPLPGGLLPEAASFDDDALPSAWQTSWGRCDDGFPSTVLREAVSSILQEREESLLQSVTVPAAAAAVSPLCISLANLKREAEEERHPRYSPEGSPLGSDEADASFGVLGEESEQIGEIGLAPTLKLRGFKANAVTSRRLGKGSTCSRVVGAHSPHDGLSTCSTRASSPVRYGL